MNYGKIGIRYAKALFLTAQEEHAVEQVHNDMLLLKQLVSENASFHFFLQTPILKPSEKKDFFQAVFANHLHPLSLHFLNLLTQNRRENRLLDIIRNLQQLYLTHKNMLSATLITTIKADDAMLNNFTQKLQSMLQKTISLQNKIDDSIVGGFILQIEDKEFDASAKTQLKKIKNNLINTSMIK
ncbi:MAG: ATP synthase F1 subunit delta [Bacteroidales bacterium]